MKFLKACCTNRRVIQFLGIIAFCLLAWFFGPLLSFGGRSPLASPFHRLLMIFVVSGSWVGYLLLAQMRAHKKDKQLVEKLSEADKAEEVSLASAKKDQLALLRQTFREELQNLKSCSGSGKRGKTYLYELPWFVIIGGPGVGKTTLLQNSGLKFPLGERQVGLPVKGVGGTRDCDWFFTEEAIFLDTAGRYTSQDSQREVDETAWHGFLQLLKKSRPRQPINGVLLAMSMDEMMTLADEDLQEKARALHRRIEELYRELGNRFPVYLIFTKADMIAGFNEFFAELSQEERIQVWGDTLPQDSDSDQSFDLSTYFKQAFDKLMQRLDSWTLARINSERDVYRRSLILKFTQQFALLQPRINDFLKYVFDSNRLEIKPMLRGIYFSSGTQEGTPIDRVMGVLASTYGMDRRQMPIFSGRGKSFFITRLLKEVIFPEAALAGTNPRVERRRRWLYGFGCAALAALTVTVIVFWSLSFIHNRSALATTDRQIAEYQTIALVNNTPRDRLQVTVKRLDLLETMLVPYSTSNWMQRMGLSQAEKMSAGISDVYNQRLERELLPEILNRLGRQLQAALYRTDDQAGLRTLYDLLKVYLMLGDPRRINVEFAEEWINLSWQRTFHDYPELCSRLNHHTSNLLHYHYEPVALDLDIIAKARQKLARIPLSQQIYAHLKGEQLARHNYDFNLLPVLPVAAQEIFITRDGQPLATQVIPGLFTRKGYNEVFVSQGMGLVKQALHDDWVMERPAAKDSDLDRLYSDLQKLYFAEYESRWDGLLQNLQVNSPRTITETIAKLDLLTGSDTPLLPLLLAVAHNTNLVEGGKTLSESTRLRASSQTRRAWLNQSGDHNLERLAQHFYPLNRLVEQSGKTSPPIAGVLAHLNAIRDILIQITNGASTEEQALQLARQRMGQMGTMDVISKANLAFKRLPAPVDKWLLTLSSSGWQLMLDTAKAKLNVIWRRDVIQPYREGLKGRYPLSIDSPDAMTTADFSRFFAPHGIIDTFFTQHLKSFIDTSGSKWRLITENNSHINLSSQTLRQFQYAAKIRDAFFPNGGRQLAINFALLPSELDKAIDTFSIFIGNQHTKYRHGPRLAKSFKWPGNQPASGVRLLFRRLDDQQEISSQFPGPWGFFRVLDRSNLTKTALKDRFQVTFQVEGYTANYELQAASVVNPFNLPELHKFHCPDSL